MSRGPQRKRWEPYTYRGIGRVPCQRCGAPSSQQWQVCADFSSYRAVCWPCDVEMNRAVLKFMRFQNADEMVEAYRKRMERAHPELAKDKA